MLQVNTLGQPYNVLKYFFAKNLVSGAAQQSARGTIVKPWKIYEQWLDQNEFLLNYYFKRIQW